MLIFQIKKPTMKIVKVFHGKTGGGYLTQFYPYTGPVTYLAITQDGDGHFKFIVAEGVNEEGKILSFGDTNMRTRFTCGAREFVNRWERMRSYSPLCSRYRQTYRYNLKGC